MSGQNGTNTRSSMTNSTGDDPNLKAGNKSARNAAHSKAKNENFDQENSENCDSEDKEISRDKSQTHIREKLAMSWMKNLNKLEAQTCISVAQLAPGESFPKY